VSVCLCVCVDKESVRETGYVCKRDLIWRKRNLRLKPMFMRTKDLSTCMRTEDISILIGLF